MNQFNSLHGDEPTDPIRAWKIQPLAFYLKPWKSPPKTSPVIFVIMGRLNRHAVDNGDVEFHPSEDPF